MNKEQKQVAAGIDVFDLAVKEYCKEAEQDGFLFAPDKNGCSLEKSNGYNSGFLNGFEKGYAFSQARIAELENTLKMTQVVLQGHIDKNVNLGVENAKLREGLEPGFKLAKSMDENFKIYKGEFTVQSQSWMADKVTEILAAEQALNQKEG